MYMFTATFQGTSKILCLILRRIYMYMKFDLIRAICSWNIKIKCIMNKLRGAYPAILYAVESALVNYIHPMLTIAAQYLGQLVWLIKVADKDLTYCWEMECCGLLWHCICGNIKIGDLITSLQNKNIGGWHAYSYVQWFAIAVYNLNSLN